jgi:hypothetical protein
MNFQRSVIACLVLLAFGLAAAFYANWKTQTRLRTVQAFVESSVFAEAVAACERAQSTTPFKWNGGKQTAVIGLNSAQQGHRHRKLYAARRQRVLRLRSDQEEGGHWF